MTIRGRLAVLVLACILPVWIAAGFLIYYSYQAKLTLIEQRMIDTSRALSLAVDLKLANIQSTLKVLAASPHLRAGNLVGFHQQAREVLRDYPDADIIMADPSGQQVVNSYRAFGETLPRRAISDAVRHVFETGEPVISDLFRGAVTKRPLISIDVPVALDGKIAYDLAMTLPVARLGDVLIQQHFPPDWLGAVLDSKGVVAARTLDPEQSVGRPARPALIEAVARTREGTIQNNTFEGVRQTMAYSRSAVSGWAVVIGIPTKSMLADLRHWLWWTLLGVATLSILGLGLATGSARRIERGIQALVSPALALGHGEPVAIDSLGVKETDAVGQALVQASDLLRARGEERDRAEEFLRASRDELSAAFARLQALNAELEAARLTAEAASTAKSAFIATMSHELRTPLTSIIGFSELIARQTFGPVGVPIYAEYAADILANGVHLNSLINDIFDIAKIESGRMEIAPIPMEAASMVRSLIRRARQDATKRSITLEEDVDPAVGTLWADERALKQIFFNLLSNALKFTPEGGTVTVGLQRAPDDAIDLVISDTGIGIPAERIEGLMAPFERVDNRYARTTGGTGLGLSLVKGLIDLHQGRITIESQPGHGTRVRVRFPPHGAEAEEAFETVS